MKLKMRRIPKTLKIAEMRKRLGDNEIERLLTVMFAGEVSSIGLPDATPDQIQCGLEWLADGPVGRGMLPKAAKGWYRFFEANPRIKSRYIAWAKLELRGDETTDEVEDEGGEEEGEPEPQPVATQQQSSALIKARAALAAKRARRKEELAAAAR